MIIFYQGSFDFDKNICIPTEQHKDWNKLSCVANTMNSCMNQQFLFYTPISDRCSHVIPPEIFDFLVFSWAYNMRILVRPRLRIKQKQFEVERLNNIRTLSLTTVFSALKKTTTSFVIMFMHLKFSDVHFEPWGHL